MSHGYSGTKTMWDCELQCDIAELVIRSADDLQLAAELGKALLERNRELEAQLQQQQQSYQEQSMELQHVTKQLETLRTMTESRNRVYEEVDRISQDLERQNQKLTMDAKADRQKIDRLTSTIERLEQKVEDLHKKLEEATKAADAKPGGKKKKEQRRTASLAALDRNHDSKGGYYMGDLAWTQTSEFKKAPLNAFEAELLKLQESLQHCKTQLAIEKRRKDDLEVDLDVLEQENKSLQKKVTILEEKLSEAMLLEYELEQARKTQSPEGVCRNCRKIMDMHEEIHAPEAELLSEVEHDTPLLLSEAKAVKLEGGGSLYSSSESLNKVSDAREIEESRSILTELETQYKSLFEKYEQLIQNKNKRLSQVEAEVDPEAAEDRAARRRQAHKEVQTLLHMTLNRDYFTNPEPCQPPPYKALFKDLFDTLRKSRIDENPEQDGGRLGATTPGDPPSTSPSMEFSRVTAGLSELSRGLLTSPVALPNRSMALTLEEKDRKTKGGDSGGAKADGDAAGRKAGARVPKPKTDKKPASGANSGGDCKNAKSCGAGGGGNVLTSPTVMKEEVYES